MLKMCFVDTETTGVVIGKHAIHQLSYILVDNTQLGGPVAEQRTIHIMPFEEALYHPEAMRMVGLSEEEMRCQYSRISYSMTKTYFTKDLEQYVSRFDKTDKFVFIAYNAPFDDGHCRHLWDRSHDKYYGAYFWWPAIDVAQLALYKLGATRFRLPNFKLGTVCSYFGVPFDPNLAHDAGYDIQKTMELFWAIAKDDHNLGTMPTPDVLKTLGLPSLAPA